jgi:ABC-type branched-subunit amino acid transport system permease subunit
MASIPSGRRPLPAATLLVTAVYAAAAVLALALGGPAQRLAGLAVLALTAARLAAIRAAGKGAGPWS